MVTNDFVSKAVENITQGLSAIVEDAVLRVLQNYSIPNPQSGESSTFKEEDDFTDIYGAMKITHYKRNTIYDYVAKKKNPHQKVRRKLIFSKSALIKWIKDSKVKTEAEIAAEAQIYVANNKMGRHGRK